jgi:hypothetical protein
MRRLDRFAEHKASKVESTVRAGAIRFRFGFEPAGNIISAYEPGVQYYYASTVKARRLDQTSVIRGVVTRVNQALLVPAIAHLVFDWVGVGEGVAALVRVNKAFNLYFRSAPPAASFWQVWSWPCAMFI